MSTFAKYGVIAVVVTSLLVGSAFYSSMYLGSGGQSNTSSTSGRESVTSATYSSTSTTYSSTSTTYSSTSTTYSSTSTWSSLQSQTSYSASSSSSYMSISSLTSTVTSSSLSSSAEPTQVTVSGIATYDEQSGQCGGGHTPTGVTFQQSSDNVNYTASFTPSQSGTNGTYTVTVPNNENYGAHITWTSVCGDTAYAGACAAGTLSLQSSSAEVRYNIDCS